jgi:protoporphyrinogen oxidase
LGAGLALHGLGFENWKIYEKEYHVGGLSASFTAEKGFTWDQGGHVLFNRSNLSQRIISTGEEEEDRYDILTNTMPLDELIPMLGVRSPTEIKEAARGLESNQVTVVGVGLSNPNNSTKCWIYFPDPSIPFYRVTNFSYYSPFNVPGGEVSKLSSLICETGHIGDKDEGEIVEKTLEGLLAEGFLEKDEEQISISVRTLPRAYPIPTRGRDLRLSSIQKFLEENDIHSIGRFGTWRYEVGNMDHAVMMGMSLFHALVRS